jgi:SulP family sulfate permease
MWPAKFSRFSLVPSWIRQYKAEDLRFDIMAGIAVAVMMVPQGMAYAMLAGLPPIYGLYASTIPMIVYAYAGTSRHLSVGPVAIDSILTAAGVSMLAVAGSGDYIAIAITLAFMVGFIQFALGSSRLGFLVNFLSHPVIQGFTSAAAIIIALSQLRYLLGIDIQGHQYLHELIRALILHIHETHLLTLAIGLISLLLLMLFTTFKKTLPGIPGALLVVVFSTLAVYFFRLHEYGVKIVGSVPQGLPLPGLPLFDIELLKKLLPTAFAIALVSFMESNAIAKALQSRHKTYTIKPNRELLSIGLANMIGSVFKSFPVSGGLSRSAFNEQSGARTGLAAIVTALLVILTLLFLTPLFYYLPNVVLAAIIIFTVYKLINLPEAKYLWKLDRKDFVMMLVTFLGTLFLGIGNGIAIGVLLSLAWIIYEASYPHFAELGRVPGTQAFRNIKRFQELDVEEGVLIFRFDAPLFFANIARFRDILFRYKSWRKEKLRAIVVDMESINAIDTTALRTLSDIMDEIKAENILLLFTEVKGPVRDKLQRSGLTQKLGADHFFITINDAVEYATGRKKDFTSDIALQSND